MPCVVSGYGDISPLAKSQAQGGYYPKPANVNRTEVTFPITMNSVISVIGCYNGTATGGKGALFELNATGNSGFAFTLHNISGNSFSGTWNAVWLAAGK